MGKIIKIKESDIKRFINEQLDIDEYGIKGMRHDDTYLWDEGDQMLAMYNAEYGIEELGISKEEAVTEIIGTSLGSLGKQTSNFNYLAGRGGLDRPNKMQTHVYNKFKGIPRETFKKVCLDLIENRLENPTERVLKRKLGKEIGTKRDEASNERRNKLTDAGVNPDRATMINQRPKYEPVPDEEPTDIQPQSPRKNTPKDEIGGFLKSLYMKAMETNPELADDIQFISDYIDSELIDKEMLSEIKKIFKYTITESKTNKMKKVIRIKESDIKSIVKRILNEQEEFDSTDEISNDGNEILKYFNENGIKARITTKSGEVYVPFKTNFNKIRLGMNIKKSSDGYVYSISGVVLGASFQTKDQHIEHLGSFFSNEQSGDMFENKNSKKVNK